MANPVWVLSVDLQTKTATFQSGMADAAKSARGAFTDIKSGSGEMAEHIGGNMFASRHAIMAVSEAFGVQVPRAITALLAHIGPVGAALEAAFPFAAVALGAVLLIEEIGKLHEEGIKLTQDQMRFGTAANNAFNSLDEKILQAGIRSDDLRNNHLGALQKQLALIDKQSMAELVKEFETLQKAADVVFEDLKGNWYSIGIGSDGAKHALTEFQVQYASLLAQGKEGEGSDLLHGTLQSAQKVLQAQQQIKAANAETDGKGWAVGVQKENLAAFNALKAAGVGYTEKEMKAQEQIVDTLTKQLGIESRVNTLKGLDKGNATTATGKEAGQRQAEAARQAADHAQKLGELTVAAEREAAQVSAAIHNATIDERLAADTKLENESYAIQQRGNAQRIAALDKGGKDYANQLKAAQDKATELTAEHENALASLSGKAQEERYRKDLTDLQTSEREKISATDEGSSERLAAVDAAIREEKSKRLEETSFYRELLTQRAEILRKSAEEESKLQAEAGKLTAEQSLKMGELALASQREKAAVADSARRMTLNQQIAEAVQFANEDFAIKQSALQREIDALDKTGKDYSNKLMELQNKEKQLVQSHEDEITAIKDKAVIDQNEKQKAAMARFVDMTAQGLTQVIMRHQSFAAAMASVGNTIVSGMLDTALKSMMTMDMDKERQAASAARTMFLAGAKFPFPANIVAAPAMGAAAFASMMAFEAGGVVPGIGRGDVVPAMLSPGEGIIPGSMMARLDAMSKTGGMDSGTTIHVHYAPTNHVQTIDGDGIQDVLDKHTKQFTKHVEGTLRRMNK